MFEACCSAEVVDGRNNQASDASIALNEVTIFSTPTSGPSIVRPNLPIRVPVVDAAHKLAVADAEFDERVEAITQSGLLENETLADCRPGGSGIRIPIQTARNPWVTQMIDF